MIYLKIRTLQNSHVLSSSTHQVQTFLMANPIFVTGSINSDFLLLLSVKSVFFVNENKIQEILNTELVVSIVISWRQLVRAQEQPNRDRLSCKSEHVR